jgi:Zn-dependent M28 family amino/carboxypeptidase
MLESRRRLSWRALSVLGLLVLATATSLADDAVSYERMKKDIFFLASPECEGRGVETQGIQKAAEYIVAQLHAAGCKPGGKDGSWFQPFTLSDGAGKVEGINTLTLHGPLGQEIELTRGRDFEVLPMSGSGQLTASVVFAGYGLQVKSAEFDDFKGVDVAGKVVIVLRRVPRWDNEAAQFAGHKEAYAGLESKIGNCELHRAAAVILVNDRSEAAGGDKFATVPGGAASSGGVPTVQLRRSIFDMMLTSKGTTLADLEKDIDRDLKPRSGVLPGWTASVHTTLKRPTYDCKNIVAVVEGSGPLANETVVIGAHYDHWGYGGWGSLAKDKTVKQIHPGADDNGSGTTTILEVARRFAAHKDRQGRRLVFIWFSGEERGLIGSRFYCNKEPLFPLADTVAMVNLDMVGRLHLEEPKLKVEGVGTGKGFDELIDAANSDLGFVLQKKKGGTGPSDHDSFCRKDIPVLFFWTGFHEDYHRPTDTADKINVAGMVKIAGLTEKIVTRLATMEKRPEYVYIAEQITVGGGVGPRMRVGLDYGDESNKGVVVESVVKDGPAAKGGMLAGDRIVAINGQPTMNLNAYMAVMRQQKTGVPLDVTVHRKGTEVKLKVTPE